MAMPFNLLLPQGMAIAATPQAMKRAASEKAKMEGRGKSMRAPGREYQIARWRHSDYFRQSQWQGHLFAGLHREAIVKELLAQTRIQVDPSFIQLDQPLKTVGEHIIEVKAEGKSAKFKVIIQAA